MTGVTLQLADYQFEGLCQFEDGEAHELTPHVRARSPWANLLRRGMLQNTGAQSGVYTITQLGREALRAYREEALSSLPGRVHPDVH